MIEFVVKGEPVSQGSMKAFVSKSTKRVIVQPDNSVKLKAWRKAVAEAAAQVWPAEPLDEPLRVDVQFYRTAPPSQAQYRYDSTGRDLDKLLRAIYDAITGVIVTNDARIVGGAQWKYLTEKEPYAHVRIEAVNYRLVQPTTIRE